MKVGILTSSVREGRKSLTIAQWVAEVAKNHQANNTYEIVDIKDYNLPMMGVNVSEEEGARIGEFSNKVNSFDAFVFVVAEYNHGLTGAFKNALDYLMNEFTNKVVGYVGYGGVGGARAIEQLRMINGEQGLASVRKNVNLLLAHDFVNYSEFNPQEHQAMFVNELLDQLTSWGNAFKSMRESK